MPVVRVTGRQVAPTPLPRARRTAAETALSEGAGVEEARVGTGLAIAQVGATVAETGLRVFAQQEAERRRQAEESRREADTAALVAADNRLSRWVIDRLQDPDTGALTIRGKDAQGLPEQLDQEFLEAAAEIEAGLTTAEQRAGFQPIRGARRNALQADIQPHVAKEKQKYYAAELQTAKENAKQQAIAHAAVPPLADAELQAGVRAIEAMGRQVGLGPDAIAHEVRALESEVVIGIIAQQLAEGHTTIARDYFEDAGAKILPDKRDDVLRALRAGSVRQEAQQAADRIVGAGGTLTAQREQAKAIADPDVRDEALKYVEHEAQVRAAAAQAAHETRLRDALNVLDRTPDVRQVPGDLWVSLNREERNGLFDYAADRASGRPIQTDDRIYYDRIQEASTTPDAFAARNLLGDRHHLADGDFKKLVDLQADIRKGDREKANAFLDAGFRSEDQLITEALGGLGFDAAAIAKTPTTREGKALLELRRTFERQIGAHAALTGKLPTQDEKQQILDNILQQLATPGVARSFWFDTRGRIFSNVAVEDVPTAVSKIPADDRRKIEEALRARGRAITDRAILDLYIDRLTGGR